MKVINLNYLILSLLFFQLKDGFANDLMSSDSAGVVPYFSISNLSVSANGRWSALTKQSKDVQDTLLIFDLQAKQKPAIKLVGRTSFTSFLSDHQFLSVGQGKAMLSNLARGSTKEFGNVKQGGVLSAHQTFFLLGSDGVLSCYNYMGVIQSSVAGIQRLITDKRKILIGVNEIKPPADSSKNPASAISTETIVTDVSRKQPVQIFSTKNRVIRINLTSQGNYLTILEEIAATSKVKVTIIDWKTKQSKTSLISDSKSFLNIYFIEIAHSKSLWIDLLNKEILEPSVVDIWYGNDGDLKAKQYSYAAARESYFWDEFSDSPQRINNDKFPFFVPFAGRDKVLAFNPRVNFKYVTRVPHPTLFLYDTRDHSYKEIFNHSLEVVVSPDGKKMLSFNSKEKKWFLYELSSGKISSIVGANLMNPVFDVAGGVVFFESDNGLWIYDLKSHTLKVLSQTDGNKVSIINEVEHSLNSEYHMSKRSLDPTRLLLCKMVDQNNQSAYFSYKNSKYQLMLPKTSNLVSQFALSNDGANCYSTEENYNLPPRLYHTKVNNGDRQLLYAGNVEDREAFAIRQEVIGFTNSEGKKLKGLLYYPLNFDQSVKYPMVVHIYQVRSTGANIFYQAADDVGFDLRALLKKGYFVYMPDIVYGDSGPARSALDCVHGALDAIKLHPNINQDRIGLTGHSMGGYEANFIATQSDRFRTYISGSAHADLIRDYFSFNYHTYLPQIWRKETGQYEMGASFAEDKEKYFKNSPINYVDQVQTPILLWTGMKDENVKWEQTMEFYMGLKRFDKDVIALFYKDGDHTFYDTPLNNKDIIARSLQWWDYFLKDSTEVDWINKQMSRVEK